MSARTFIERDPALPVAHCTIAFDLGSLVDPVGKEGACSLLFRLLRRSVPGLTPTEVEQRLDSLGASVGVDVGRSVAALQATYLSRSSDAFSQLLVSMLASPPSDEAEFLRLKAEVQAEWVDSLDNDALIARRFFTRHIFAPHPYARLTSGTPQSIERIELADLKLIHQRVVNQARLIASFSGDVTTAQVEALMDQLALHLPTSSDYVQAPCDDPVVLPGRHLYFVDKPERSQVQILMGCAGAHPKDADRTALYVGNIIFGGTFSARLSREVRINRGWSYGAYSQLSHDRARQSFSMWTFPQASDAAACIQLELELLEQLIERGVTKSELVAAKKYLLNSHAFSIDTASKRATLALDEQLYSLPPLSTFKDRVSGVTVDQIHQALRSRLSAQNLVVVVLGTKDPLLSAIEASIAGLSASQVMPFDLRE